MNKLSRLIVTGTTVAATGFLGLGGLVSAASLGQPVQATQNYRVHLSQLNDSGDRGTARIQVKGDQVTVRLRTYGASPNLPHAQHLHIGGDRHVCPTLGNDDADHDGFISSVEGTPSYGPVRISLTTSGDMSPGSGLAVDRFPVANANGMVDYQRTFTLPAGVSAADIENAVIVQHGISELFNDPAKYDGDKRSTLDASLPFEATVPASCGKLVPVNNAQGNHGQGNNGQAAHGSGNSISNTGPDSTNSIVESSNSTTQSTTSNDVNISNESNQTATSGKATNSGNTSSGADAVGNDSVNSGAGSNDNDTDAIAKIEN